MSISSRSQTARLYTYSGGNDAGYASGSYITDGVLYFCRVVEGSARERMATGRIHDTTAAVVELADEVAVPSNALFRIGGNLYRVKGIARRPLRRVNQYTVEWMDQPIDAVEMIANGAFLLDGSRSLNAINPSLPV